MNSLNSLINVPIFNVEKIITCLYQKKTPFYHPDFRHHFNITNVQDFTFYFIKYFEQALTFNFTDKMGAKYFMGPAIFQNKEFVDYLSFLYEDFNHLMCLEKFLLSFIDLTSLDYSEHTFEVLKLFFPEDIYEYDHLQETSKKLKIFYLENKDLTPLFIHFMNSLSSDQRSAFYNLYGLVFYQ